MRCCERDITGRKSIPSAIAYLGGIIISGVVLPATSQIGMLTTILAVMRSVVVNQKTRPVGVKEQIRDENR